MILSEIEFNWDDEKNKRNIEIHGISFETAAYVFLDPDYLEIFDTEHSENEDRFIVIGRVKEVLFVVYTERNSAIRLISARKATERERRLYYGRIQN